MKTFELKGPVGIEGLTLAERPVPTIADPNQVLVKMRAVSLNYRDLLIVNGAYNPKLRMPHIPLSDGVGEVITVGQNVTRVKLGDRVIGTFAPNWLCGELRPAYAQPTLGGELDGVLAEYALFHQDALVHAPPHLTDEEAATLPCAALTAWSALFADGNVKPGDAVLVIGTGNISLFAVQFARLAGANVIVMSSSDDKLERARRLGACDGINYKRFPDWEEQVLKLTGSAGVDHVVEVGGAGTLAQSLRAVRMGGTVSLIGILSGVSAEIPILPILMKKVRVQGIYVGSRNTFETMNSAIAMHKLKPVVDRIFSFAEAKQAFYHKQTGTDFGKVIIRF